MTYCFVVELKKLRQSKL